MTLYSASSQEHLALAKHLTAEQKVVAVALTKVEEFVLQRLSRRTLMWSAGFFRSHPVRNEKRAAFGK